MKKKLLLVSAIVSALFVASVSYASYMGTLGAGLIVSSSTANGYSVISNTTGTPFYKNGTWAIGNAVDAGGNPYSTSTGGTPAGSTSDVQINQGGAFAADSGNFKYSTTTKQLAVSTPSSSVLIGSSTASFNSLYTMSIAYTNNATSSFTVPAGVTSLIFNLQGGAGGNNGNSGGNGGSSTGTLAVSAGQVIYYCVGGQGVSAGCGGAGAGGPNGGPVATAGGGMTWISKSPSFSTSTVLLVAGGGGGVGSNNVSNSTGFGGGTSGVAGTGSGNGGAGGGGTPSAGGAGGTSVGTGNGTAGGEGTGGAGAGTPGNYGGGGGGGGFFGGGGGGSGTTGPGGGGGGSGFASTTALTATSTATSTNTGAGSIFITANGGLTGDVASSSYALAVGGHIITGGGSPTVANCGSGASVVGSDNAGIITPGSNATCQLVYQTASQSQRACTANSIGVRNYLWFTNNAITSTVINASTSLTSSNLIAYNCFDY